MVDLESYILAVKSAWIPRLITMSGYWTAIPIHSFENLRIRFINVLRSSLKDAKKLPNYLKVPPFYIECLIAFNKYKNSNQNNNGKDLLSDCIWLNEKFLYKNKYLFLKNWICSGFMYLKDFFNKDGKFISSQEIHAKLRDKTGTGTPIRLKYTKQ